VRGYLTLFAIALVGASVSACAAVAGLDDFTKGSCSGGACDGATDVTVPHLDAAPDHGSTVQRMDTGPSTMDAPIDTGRPGRREGGPGDSGDGAVDAAEASRSDAAEAGVPNDSGGDSGLRSDATDASPRREAGCGPLDVPANCTACGLACATGNSLGASCDGTTCAYTGCATGFADCNAATAPDTDGCETPTNTAGNCTGCGITCDSVHSIGATCSGTTCVYTGCAPGYADCNTAAPDTDGCETFIGSTTTCGACGQSCDTVHSTGASCVNGTCEYTGCAAGYSDCVTSPPNTNGCETETNTLTNCGACGVACDTAHSMGTACDGTACTYTGCDTGYADCQKTAPNANGCETSLSSTSSCSACGDTCNATNSTATTCSGTSCKYACATGFADCTTGSAPDLGGCATPTTTTSNCGGCGNVCKPTGATADTCLGLSCSYTCSANHSDCNADVAPDTDGCECATPGCCGNSCQTAHTNGVGQTYYDCNPVSTFTLVTATEACTAFAPTVGGTAANCSSGWTCPGDKSSYVCYGTGSGANLACVDYCWAFATGEAGAVFTCSCPDTSVGSTWK